MMNSREFSENFTGILKRFYYQYAPYLLPDEDLETEISISSYDTSLNIQTQSTSPEINRNVVSKNDNEDDFKQNNTDKLAEDREQTEETNEEEQYEIVMTEEATQIFARGEKRRRERRRQREEERKQKAVEAERAEEERMRELQNTWRDVALSQTVMQLQAQSLLPGLTTSISIDSFPQFVSYGSYFTRIRSLENTLNSNFDRLCGGNDSSTPHPPTLWPEFPIRVLSSNTVKRK